MEDTKPQSLHRIMAELAGAMGFEMDTEPGNKALNWLVSTVDEPQVTHSDLARNSPCRCYKHQEAEYCTSPGIVGVLDEELVREYCEEKEYAPEGVSQEVAKKAQVAEGCKPQLKGQDRSEDAGEFVSCYAKGVGREG